MPERIVSGGQTGVDQAALDIALELGIPCGGWCPRGRWSESGRIDDQYPLNETESANPAERTRLNVRDSDATLILAVQGDDAGGGLTGGTALTRTIAEAIGRPVLVVDPLDPDAPRDVARWLDRHAVGVLNVAGPRESSQPGIHDLARTLLRRVLGGSPC